jgi:CVNH domain
MEKIMSHIKKHHFVESLTALVGFTSLALATGLILSNSSAKAQSVPASSYQSSCNNINIVSPGDIIRARCLKINLSLNTTSIRFKGIYNNNGVLTFSNLNSSSSFQNSCTNITITGNTLVANCRRVNNTYNTTSILVPGIRNNNGVLTY